MTGEEGIPITTSDGVRLHLRRWRPATQARGVVVLVHGYGEHGGRYEPVAEFLIEAGFRVVAFDQRGHGRSGGVPAFIEHFDEYLTDLDTVLHLVRTDESSEVPVILWGQSMGGLAVVRHLQTRPGHVVGAVISAPWLATKRRTPWWKVALGKVLLRVAPTTRVRVGLDPETLTRDPECHRAYRDDPLIHSFVTPGLYWAVADAQRLALADPAGVRGPALVMVPEADEVVDPEATLDFLERASAPDVETCRLPGLLHEPHNEPEREEVFARVRGWLDRHFLAVPFHDPEAP